ncbi:hypothetical protein D3C87_1277900 [compost metagenome]
MSEDVIAELTSFGSVDDDMEVAGSINPETGRRSRFFFRLSDRIINEEDQRIAEISKKKEIPQSDREIIDRGKTYAKELPKSMLPMVDEVREFFLHELAPKMMAAGAGIVQAESVVELITGTEVNESTGHSFRQMLSIASNIRMSRMVAKYMGLDERDAQLLLEKISPTKEVIFMNPDPQHPVRGMEHGQKTQQGGPSQG